jgi:oxalate---CoA ligase
VNLRISLPGPTIVSQVPAFIDWIDAHGRNSPGRVYLADARGDRVVTYGRLAVDVRAWWSELDRHRIGAGARIGLALTDPLDFAVAYLAIVSGGRVAVPLNPAAPPADTARAVRVRDVRVAVTDRPAAFPATVHALAPLPAVPVPPISLPPAEAGAIPVPGGGVLLTSSGTTGEPKRILLSEDQLAHVAAGVAEHHRLRPTDTGYCPLPLFHINAEVVGLLATLAAGARLVLDRRVHRRGLWELLAAREVTWVNAVPAMLAILAGDGDAPAARRTRIRFVRSASAPLPAAVADRFERNTGLRIVETYGMTEAASQITANPIDGPQRPGSVGLPVGVDLRVVSAAGDIRAAGEVGTVQIRGKGVIRRYAGAAGADRFTHDGWLDTGDLGYRDRDGYLYLTGRVDDVINRGGEKIFPRDVEEILLADPRVRDAVVVGRPDPVLGQVPVALVVAWQAGHPGLAADLAARCEAGLAAFQRPKAIEIVGSLPAGPTGKILRRAAA